MFGTPLFINATVTVTRAGATILANQPVQFDDDPAAERLMTGSAPTLHKILYDQPPVAQAGKPFVPLYLPGDVVTLASLTDEPYLLPYTIFHAWNVQYTGDPLPATEVALVRLNVFMQAATWWSRITEHTAGAAPSSAWDTTRALPTSFSDGTFGVDITAAGRHGYLAPAGVSIGLLERKTAQEVRPAGLMVYENAVFFYEPPTVVKKGDVLALLDGRRGTVGDVVQVHQLNGVTFATMAELNLADLNSNSIIYSIA